MLNLIGIHIKRQFNWRKTLLLQLLIILSILALAQWFGNFEDDILKQQQIKLGLIVNDQHPMIDVLLDNFLDNANFMALFDVQIDKQNEIDKRFKNGLLDAYIIIPEQFTSRTLHYQANELTIYAKRGFPTKLKVLESIFQSYSHYIRAANAATISLVDMLTDDDRAAEDIGAINRQFSIEIISTALGRTSLFRQSQLTFMADSQISDYFIIAIANALIAFMTIPMALQSYHHLVQGVAKRLLITGVTSLGYLAALHIGQIAIILLNLLALIGLLLWQNPLFGIKFIVVIIVNSLIFHAIWLTLCLLIRREQTYLMVAFIVAFGLTLIGGAITPYALLPSGLKMISAISPIYLSTFWIVQNKLIDPIMIPLWLALASAAIIYQWHMLNSRVSEVVR